MKPLLLALCALLFFQPTIPLQAADAKSPLYLALFRLSIGADEKLQSFEVIKVIDLLSGSNNAVSIELPQSFIDQARTKIAGEHLKPTLRDGQPSSTLSSFLYAPAEDRSAPPGISFAGLNGAMNTTSDFRLLERNAAVSTFGAHFGQSAFFVSYYALPAVPQATPEQRAAIIAAEVQRSAANVQNAEILSRKDLSTESQNIVEVVCKSPRNWALTIRSRYLCNDRQMLALTAITPEGLSSDDTQSFDRLFTAFRFPPTP